MDQGQLEKILGAVEPVQLRGVQLLRELRLRHPGELFPRVSPENTGEVVEAAIELIGYAQRCQKAVQALEQLKPIVLHSFEILEYL